jgi:7-cyano-7-deazaguanine synthase
LRADVGSPGYVVELIVLEKAVVRSAIQNDENDTDGRVTENWPEPAEACSDAWLPSGGAGYGFDLSILRRYNRISRGVTDPFAAAGAELRRGIPFGRAICLLSGGLDSATCLAYARRDGLECYALSFDYGQRHRIEIEAARRIAEALGAKEHRVVKIDLRAFGHSALTDDIDVPKNREEPAMSAEIPVTYVPARNTIFLSFALAWAEVVEANDIFIGVNALDYSGYPDCRPEYIEAFERMANLATKAGVEGRTRVKIHTPLIRLSKADIVRLGQELRVPFALTHSCYDPGPDGNPCGACDSCLLRAKGFREAGVTDSVLSR